jgi:hypothetical protein
MPGHCPERCIGFREAFDGNTLKKTNKHSIPI